MITGAAPFLDPHTVAVGEGDDRITVTAPTILINTGSEPVVPAIPGLAASKHLVSSTELTRTTAARAPGGHRRRLPRARVRVDLPALRHATSRSLEAAERLLPREDEDIAASRHGNPRPATASRSSPARGSPRCRQRRRLKVSYAKDGQTHTVEAGALLPATGRRPSPRASGSTPPACAPRRTARSRSTSTCAPASRTSTPSATSTAARSSPTSPSTTPGSCWTSCSARASAPRPTGSPCRTRCSSPRRWRPSA